MRTFCLLAIAFASCTQQRDSGQFDILNTKIYYEERGSGAPLLMLSGGGLNRSTRDFDAFISFLPKRYRVITPDSPGQGNSSQPDSLSYPLLIEYFSQFIDSMKLDSVYVIGLSDGGIAALLLAQKRPDKVKKSIAVGANYGLRGALPPEFDVNTVVPMALDDWAKNNKSVVENYMKQPGRDWRKMMSQFNKMWYAHEYFPKSLLSEIAIPTLIVLGDKDDIILEHGVEMHRLIKHGSFCALPNTSHEVFAEKPELMSKIAVDFFENY